MTKMFFSDQVFQEQTLPDWFKQDIPAKDKMEPMKKLIKEVGLHTVCEGAHCPNTGRCWSQGVATFMILGDVCTRSCRFCAVKDGSPHSVDFAEPENIASAVKKLGLGYVVITSVTRDDLEDQGADQFGKTIHALRRRNPELKIEVLIPDFSGRVDLLNKVIEAKPDVIGHNIEMVRRLYPDIRPEADYERSLTLLKNVKELSPHLLVKSGFMVGLGEEKEEIMALIQDLFSSGCDILTIGQYLAPSRTKRHKSVKRYVHPLEFDELKAVALRRGFKSVVSAPLVRSSYQAEKAYRHCMQTAG